MSTDKDPRATKNATRRSVRTREFMKMLGGLPPKIRERADSLFAAFEEDPTDPILSNEPLYDSKKGRHRSGSHSVSITIRYRAIYVVDNGKHGDGPEQYCWYWVGSHEDYNNFVGS